MSTYVITTDSNADLIPEYKEEHNVTIIPQYYALDEETVYGDEIEMDPHDFYEAMRSGIMPRSMANNPEVIRERFEKILKEGKDILHIAFSSELSGSCANVILGAQELMEKYPDRKILVFDSLNASMGEGCSVYRAFDLQAQGKSLEEVYDTLMEERNCINVDFTVDDLDHLHRGGRVSKTTAVVGGLVNIKPMLVVTSEGKLVTSGTVRGRKKSIRALFDRFKLEEDLDRFGKDWPVAVMHGDAPEEARSVVDELKEMGYTNVIMGYIGASIGTHAGPGLVGIIHYGKQREPWTT